MKALNAKFMANLLGWTEANRGRETMRRDREDYAEIGIVDHDSQPLGSYVISKYDVHRAAGYCQHSCLKTPLESAKQPQLKQLVRKSE